MRLWYMTILLVMLTMVLPCKGGGLKEFLSECLKGYYPYQEIEVKRISTIDPLPQGLPESVEVKEVSATSASLLLRYAADRMARVKVYIQGYERVVLSKRFLRRGEVIGKSDIYMGLQRAESIPSDALRRAEDVLGKVVNRSLVPNSIMRAEMLLRGPLVKKGRPVLIVVETESFRITVPGRLSETAGVGEMVRVENLDTHRTVKGVLVDENTVKVAL